MSLSPIAAAALAAARARRTQARLASQAGRLRDTPSPATRGGASQGVDYGATTVPPTAANS